jgi:hypothetical protein
MSLALLLWSTTTVHSSLPTAMSFISCFTLHATSMFLFTRIHTTINIMLNEVVLLVFLSCSHTSISRKTNQRDQTTRQTGICRASMSIDEHRQLVVIVRTGYQLFTLFFALFLTSLFIILAWPRYGTCPVDELLARTSKVVACRRRDFRVDEWRRASLQTETQAA